MKHKNIRYWRQQNIQKFEILKHIFYYKGFNNKLSKIEEIDIKKRNEKEFWKKEERKRNEKKIRNKFDLKIS